MVRRYAVQSYHWRISNGLNNGSVCFTAPFRIKNLITRSHKYSPFNVASFKRGDGKIMRTLSIHELIFPDV